VIHGVRDPDLEREPIVRKVVALFEGRPFREDNQADDEADESPSSSQPQSGRHD
jgi:hypothetical protein